MPHASDYRVCGPSDTPVSGCCSTYRESSMRVAIPGQLVDWWITHVVAAISMHWADTYTHSYRAIIRKLWLCAHVVEYINNCLRITQQLHFHTNTFIQTNATCNSFRSSNTSFRCRCWVARLQECVCVAVDCSAGWSSSASVSKLRYKRGSGRLYPSGRHVWNLWRRLLGLLAMLVGWVQLQHRHSHVLSCMPCSGSANSDDGAVVRTTPCKRTADIMQPHAASLINTSRIFPSAVARILAQVLA